MFCIINCHHLYLHLHYFFFFFIILHQFLSFMFPFIFYITWRFIQLFYSNALVLLINYLYVISSLICNQFLLENCPVLFFLYLLVFQKWVLLDDTVSDQREGPTSLWWSLLNETFRRYVKGDIKLRCIEEEDRNYCLNWIELNGIGVRALLGPMDLGLGTGPLCAMFYYQIRGALFP